jgi:hypothetical protein
MLAADRAGCAVRGAALVFMPTLGRAWQRDHLRYNQLAGRIDTAENGWAIRAN